MPSHFFTNQEDNSLLKKFNGLFTEMVGLEVFRAVVGYFRASGYFKIREHLQKLSEVKILVGINVDSIVADAQQRGLLFTNNPDKTRDEFVKWMQQDIREAKYTKEVEESVMFFMQDVMDGKIEVRAHNSKKLHAKFYIFLQSKFNEHTHQRVIMGSSNLTEAGLGGEKVRSNYEMNVELSSYDDVKFAHYDLEHPEFTKELEDTIIAVEKLGQLLTQPKFKELNKMTYKELVEKIKKLEWKLKKPELEKIIRGLLDKKNGA